MSSYMIIVSFVMIGTLFNHKPIGRSPRDSLFKNQTISNDRMNRRPKWLNLNFFPDLTHEIIKHCLRAPEWAPGDKTWAMKASKKIINILRLLEKS